MDRNALGAVELLQQHQQRQPAAPVVEQVTGEYAVIVMVMDKTATARMEKVVRIVITITILQLVAPVIPVLMVHPVPTKLQITTNTHPMEYILRTLPIIGRTANTVVEPWERQHMYGHQIGPM